MASLVTGRSSSRRRAMRKCLTDICGGSFSTVLSRVIRKQSRFAKGCRIRYPMDRRASPISTLPMRWRASSGYRDILSTRTPASHDWSPISPIPIRRTMDTPFLPRRAFHSISAGARETLIAGDDRHPNAFVRLEAAWALAKTGSEFGWQRLAQLCLNPRFAERAIDYLEELRLGAHIPPKARDPDFR